MVDLMYRSFENPFSIEIGMRFKDSVRTWEIIDSRIDPFRKWSTTAMEYKFLANDGRELWICTRSVWKYVEEKTIIQI